MHTSIRQNAEACIRQEIIGRLSATDWSLTNCLADLDQSCWYFDEYGAPVASASGALYTACLDISNCAIPGATESNSYLRTVAIKVTDLPAALHPFEDCGKFRCYTVTIARMDK